MAGDNNSKILRDLNYYELLIREQMEQLCDSLVRLEEEQGNRDGQDIAAQGTALETLSVVPAE